MEAFQLIANGTDLKTRKNKNIYSRKIFLDDGKAQEFKDEFYCICTNPIEGCPVQLDSEEEVSITIVPMDLVGDFKNA